MLVARFALDTGATGTLANAALLTTLGYDPALVSDRVQVTTGSSVEYVARVRISEIRALGLTRTDFPVLVHTLPPSSNIDGLLGLDFLRGKILKIDFCQGKIELR